MLLGLSATVGLRQPAVRGSTCEIHPETQNVAVQVLSRTPCRECIHPPLCDPHSFQWSTRSDAGFWIRPSKHLFRTGSPGIAPSQLYTQEGRTPQRFSALDTPGCPLPVLSLPWAQPGGTLPGDACALQDLRLFCRDCKLWTEGGNRCISSVGLICHEGPSNINGTGQAASCMS